jgi:peptidyl-prolyl cis-trans isomerase A (cyclophilin A)
MKMLRLTLLTALLPTALMAQTPITPPSAAPSVAPAPLAQPIGIVRVALTTSMGVITLDLETKRAPITTANFLRYVDQKRFDGVTIYRAMKLGENQGLIQGGPSGDPKRVLKPIAHEPTTKTGLKHIAGAISMARWAPGTATADFSILASAMPALDADPTTKGVGVMKGQMIAAPVKIISARRVRIAATVPPKL